MLLKGCSADIWVSFQSLLIISWLRNTAISKAGDIYEYKLSFTPEGTSRIVKHLWEVKSAGLKYFDFDENCSFHLLGLLEVARPGLGLRKEFSAWEYPGDTLKVIAEVPGLVQTRTFRPSNGNPPAGKNQCY